MLRYNGVQFFAPRWVCLVDLAAGKAFPLQQEREQTEVDVVSGVDATDSDTTVDIINEEIDLRPCDALVWWGTVLKVFPEDDAGFSLADQAALAQARYEVVLDNDDFLRVRDNAEDYYGHISDDGGVTARVAGTYATVPGLSGRYAGKWFTRTIPLIKDTELNARLVFPAPVSKPFTIVHERRQDLYSTAPQTNCFLQVNHWNGTEPGCEMAGANIFTGMPTAVLVPGGAAGGVPVQGIEQQAFGRA